MVCKWPVFVASSLLLAACASSGSGVVVREPLQVVRTCEIACDGSIGTDRSIATATAAAPASDRGAPFHASVRLARVSQSEADSLLRAVPAVFFAPGAFVVTTESAERSLGGPTAAFPLRPLATDDRAAGVVAFESQTSYVERFDLTTSDRSALLDPIVGVCTTGDRVTLLPRRNDGDGSWTVELALRSVDFDRPAHSASVGLLGSDRWILLEVPIVALVETRTSATLARGESLLVVAPEFLSGDRCVVAIVSPD